MLFLFFLSFWCRFVENKLMRQRVAVFWIRTFYANLYLAASNLGECNRAAEDIRIAIEFIFGSESVCVCLSFHGFQRSAYSVMLLQAANFCHSELALAIVKPQIQVNTFLVCDPTAVHDHFIKVSGLGIYTQYRGKKEYEQ